MIERDSLGRFQKLRISLSPTKKLGYACGLIAGDGCIYRYTKTRNHLVYFVSTKKEFISLAKNAMTKIGLHPFLRERVVTRRFPNGTVKTDLHYILISNSKILYEALIPFMRPKSPWHVPNFLTTNDSLLGFLEGIYDAEGSVGSHQVTLFSKFRESLEMLSKILERFLIPTRIYIKHGGFDLHIGRRFYLEKFSKLVNFRLSWKKKKLEEILS